MAVAGSLAACRSGCDVQPTQQEFIDNAVAYFLANHQFEMSRRRLADGSYETIRYERYRDLEDFYDTNPDCCTFSYRGQEGTFGEAAGTASRRGDTNNAASARSSAG